MWRTRPGQVGGWALGVKGVSTEKVTCIMADNKIIKLEKVLEKMKLSKILIFILIFSFRKTRFFSKIPKSSF